MLILGNFSRFADKQASKQQNCRNESPDIAIWVNHTHAYVSLPQNTYALNKEDTE